MDLDDKKKAPKQIMEKFKHFLEHFKVLFYGVCLGSCSQTMLWKNLTLIYSWIPPIFAWVWWIIGSFIFALVTFMYLAKVYFHRKIVQNELKNPARSNLLFAPMLTILFLNAGAPKEIENINASEFVFFFCLIWQVALTTYLYGQWIFSEEVNLQHVQLTYLMSVVGWFVLCPLGVKLHFEKIGHFCFSVGIVFLAIVYVSLFINLGKPIKMDNPIEKKKKKKDTQHCFFLLLLLLLQALLLVR